MSLLSGLKKCTGGPGVQKHSSASGALACCPPPCPCNNNSGGFLYNSSSATVVVTGVSFCAGVSWNGPAGSLDYSITIPTCNASTYTIDSGYSVNVSNGSMGFFNDGNYPLKFNLSVDNFGQLTTHAGAGTGPGINLFGAQVTCDQFTGSPPTVSVANQNGTTCGAFGTYGTKGGTGGTATFVAT